MSSLFDGLNASRASIAAHGTAISVLADNIANGNTTGFKASRADFADLLTGTLRGGNALNPGGGSSVLNVTPILTQGSFESTGRGLDVAIDGNGYFIVQDTNGSNSRFYTRAGNFQVDTQGNLIDQNGFRVLGFPANGAGGLQALNVNDRVTDSVPSSSISITGNLDASSAVQAVPGGTPTFQQLNDAAQFSTFVDAFDSLGVSHTVSLYFFHTAAAGTWQVNAYVDGGEVTGGTAGIPSPVGSSALTFGSDGQRTAVGAPDFTATPAWNDGATAGSIDFTFDPLTQFASPSSVSSITQDGTGSGSVTGFTFGEDGTLLATLDNGQTASIGKIALATFANAEGLKRIGNSLFAESLRSGEPVVGTPATGSFGSLADGALELSTSDLASDFVKLISYQRGFQGSSRIISQINDLLNDLIQAV